MPVRQVQAGLRQVVVQEATAQCPVGFPSRIRLVSVRAQAGIAAWPAQADPETVEKQVIERVKFECRRLEMAKQYLKKLGFDKELEIKIEDD